MSHWRGKQDEDLTFEDLGDMLAEGEPVTLSGPPLPANAYFAVPVPTYGASLTETVGSPLTLSPALVA